MPAREALLMSLPPMTMHIFEIQRGGLGYQPVRPVHPIVLLID